MNLGWMIGWTCPQSLCKRFAFQPPGGMQCDKEAVAFVSIHLEFWILQEKSFYRAEWSRAMPTKHQQLIDGAVLSDRGCGAAWPG